MRGAKSAKWVVGAIVVAMAATACNGGGDSKSSSGSGGKPEGYVSVDVGEPQNPLYPTDTNETLGHYVITALYSPLVKFDDKGKILNVAAESITTEDSKTWTIKLKSGWTFHNGEKVTAQSYVDAWNWGANIKNNQKNSLWFNDIKGYEDVHPEKGDPKSDKMSGLTAKDELTLSVELNHPVPYFQYKLGYVPFMPQPQAFFKDPKGFGQKPVGQGPYKFEKWDHKKLIQVAAYDGYKGDDKPKNKGVQFKQYSTVEAAYQELMSGNLDLIRQIGPKDLPKYKSDLGDRAIDKPYAAVQSIVPAFYSEPFKDINPKVIQGLSMAIDRQTITKTVLNGTRTPATSFTPPGVEGNQSDLGVDVFKFDPAKAKDLIKEGGGVPGNKIWIQFNGDGGHKEWITAVCENIRQNTGIECLADPKPDFQADLDLRDQNKVKAMYRGGWVADYPLNVNFMRELYRTGAEANSGRFSDKSIDELFDKGDNAKTLEESVKLYQEAEKAMVQKMPAIPLWNYRINGGHSKTTENAVVDYRGDYVMTEVTPK
ncbi:ABC transporter substrate-binding protein [Streptomyces cinnamoneus]|uniref:peptide ABC transporter substrate-binding protein n=1 Tax=Streptomyces cinnamoneus TaxID=53446 RepID=UPI0033F9CA29